MREFEVTSFAQSLVEAGAACVQHHQISSTYKWEGKIEHEKEWGLSIKVSINNLDSVTQVINNLHPYDVPQIIYKKYHAEVKYYDWLNKTI